MALSRVAAPIMPSFGDQGATTTALQSFTASSLAANNLKSILENPLRFEKADLSVSTGLNGRYVPLNKPFTIHHGMSNGIKQNGIHRPASSGVENIDTTDEEEEGDHRINGEKSGQLVEEKISTQWPRVLARPPGLKNYSNTCYMNSTLQALMHIPPLVGYLLSGTHGLQCISYPFTSLTNRQQKFPRMRILSARTSCSRELSRNSSKVTIHRPIRNNRKNRR